MPRLFGVQRTISSPDKNHEAAASLLFETLNAILDATELEIGGQPSTTIPRDVSVLSEN